MTVKINICNVLDMPKYAVSHNKIKLQMLESPSYFNFIQAHTAETRKTYKYYFSCYLQFNQLKDSDVLLQRTPKEIEQNLIKYIMHLKESGLAPNTIYCACASIFSFYEMNDIDLRKGKIKKYIGELRKIHKGEAYTHQQIAKLLNVSQERLKVIILLLSSTGMRIGALPSLKLKHLTKIHEYGLYQLVIYIVYYQVNEKPEKYIFAYKNMCQLIETTAKTEQYDDGTTVHFLVHNKTYLTCIPIRIVRHRSPLTFLDSAAKYTMSFVDASDEHTTFSHKTLSEILSGLRDLGYALSDGAEGALGAMVQAYKERKEIEDNEDMDYVGFFIDKENKTIPSNIEINEEPDLAALGDALKFLEELKPYFEGRSDLLSTSIVWGMIAPAVFMLKTNNYFLKWLHFYGFPNSTKSNTGKIILGIDGHHDDPDYLLNISRIDTIARLGDILSHSTFPKLVDEVDLNGLDKVWLVNSIKSAIEGKVARSKFMSNRATSSTPIPALSPLILTSNPPPPFNDSGYMRRVIERNFPKSETYMETDPAAIQFKEFLRTDLKRLKGLGEFRNWYIVNHQEEILDEARPLALDLGLKILSEAYKAVGNKMPEWLKLRLPENQLQESIEDNTVIVKRAFEKYIDESLNAAFVILETKR